MSTTNPFTGERERVSNYFSVALGKIVKSLGKTEPANLEGVTVRTNKNGEKVYEIHSDYIAGHIVGAKLKNPPDDKPEFGKTMVFTLLAANGAKCNLDVSFDSAYGRGFLNSLPALSLDQPVEFEPYQYHSTKKGKEVSGMSVIQNGEQIQWVIGTKASPGGVPPLEKVIFKGKETWDNSKQLKFYEGLFNRFAAMFTEVTEPETVTAEAPKRERKAAPVTEDAPAVEIAEEDQAPF